MADYSGEVQIARKKMSPKQILIAIVKYVVLAFTAFASLVPIVVVVFGAFKDSEEFKTSNVLALPKSWFNFKNFVTAFVDGNMATGFINTIIIVVASVVLTIAFGTMTAYVINRFKYRFSSVVNSAFLFASLIPSITMQMSIFRLMSGLNLIDSKLGMIMMFAGTDVISIYIFVQFLENIPVSLDESAIMDGASYFTIYGRILLPLMKPAMVTVLILKGVGFYNEFYTPKLYLTSPENYVVSTALFKFKGPYSTQWEVILAAIIITVLPAFIIFILLQKQIYSGLTNGAVKE